MKTPTFAIIGHPNEGKSSIVATLAEEDSVAISPTPGETTRNHPIALMADGRAVLYFVDTPGFQNPRATLAWFRAHDHLGEERVASFIRAHAHQPDFHHDCELLKPVAEGAGILYLVNASRPLSSFDLVEMEILRLTGRPRMAIINPKSEEKRYLEEWKAAFRQNFNALRTFNTQSARYLDRVELLEALKSIDEDWAPVLNEAIEAVRRERGRAMGKAVDAVIRHLERSLDARVSRLFGEEGDIEMVKAELESEYRERLILGEERFRDEVREIFRLRRVKFDSDPPPYTQSDLFSEETWQALGLTRNQLVVAGGIVGAGLGAAADIASVGLTFGVFTSIGAALGAGSALWKGKTLAATRISRMPLGGFKCIVGPNRSVQFPFVQLSRDLLFVSFASNWAHARRETRIALVDTKENPLAAWSQQDIRGATRYIEAVKKGDAERRMELRPGLKALLERSLGQAS